MGLVMVVVVVVTQLMRPCEILTINILSMLTVGLATLEDFHLVKVVPNVEEIANFLDKIFHLWNEIGFPAASIWNCNAPVTCCC